LSNENDKESNKPDYDEDEDQSEEEIEEEKGEILSTTINQVFKHTLLSLSKFQFSVPV
jgi:hypothetical protein